MSNDKVKLSIRGTKTVFFDTTVYTSVEDYAKILLYHQRGDHDLISSMIEPLSCSDYCGHMDYEIDEIEECSV